MVTYEVSAITGLVKPQQPVGVPPQPQQVQQPAAPMGQPAQNPSQPTSGASQQVRDTYAALLKTKYEYQNSKDPAIKDRLKKRMSLMVKFLKSGQQQFMSSTPEWIAFMAIGDGQNPRKIPDSPKKKPEQPRPAPTAPLPQPNKVQPPTPQQKQQPTTPSQGGRETPLPPAITSTNSTVSNALPKNMNAQAKPVVGNGITPTKVTPTDATTTAQLPESPSNAATKDKQEKEQSADDKKNPSLTSENATDETGSMTNPSSVSPEAFKVANNQVNAQTPPETFSSLAPIVENDNIVVEQSDVIKTVQSVGSSAAGMNSTIEKFDAQVLNMPEAQDAGTTVNQAEDVVAGLNPPVENPVPSTEGQVPPPTKQDANDQLVNDPTVESNTKPEVMPQPATETPTPEATNPESPATVGQDTQSGPVKPIEVKDGDGNKIEIPATSKDAAEDEARSRGIPVSGSQNQNETGTPETPMTGEPKSETPPEQPTSQAEAADATEGVKPEDADKPVPLDEHYKTTLDQFKQNLQGYYGKPSKTLDDAENFLRNIRDGFRKYNAFLSGGVSGLAKETASQFEQSGVRENDKKILAEREKQANNLADSWAEKMTLLKTQPDAGLNPTQSAEMTTAFSKLDAKQRAMVGEMLNNELGLDKPADQYTPGDLKVRFDQYIKSQTEKALLKESDVQRQKSAHDAMVKKINAGETIPDNQLKSFASELTSIMKSDPTHLNKIAEGLGVSTVGKTNEQIKKDVIDAVSAKTETATAKAKEIETKNQAHHDLLTSFEGGKQPDDSAIKAMKTDISTADENHVKSVAGRLGINTEIPVGIQRIAIKSMLDKMTKKSMDEMKAKQDNEDFIGSEVSKLNLETDPATGEQFPTSPITPAIAAGLASGFGKLPPEKQREILANADVEGLDSIGPGGYKKAFSDVLAKHTVKPMTRGEQLDKQDIDNVIETMNNDGPIDKTDYDVYSSQVNKAANTSDQALRELALKVKGLSLREGQTIENIGKTRLKSLLLAHAKEKMMGQEPTGELTDNGDEGDDGMDGGNDGGSTVTPPTPQPTPAPASGTPTPTETPEPVASTPIDEPPATSETPVPVKEQPKPAESSAPAATGLGDERTRREGLSEKLQSYFDNNPDDQLAIDRSKAYGQLSAAEQRELTHVEKNSDVLAQLDKIADNIKNGRDKLEGTKIAEVRKGTAEAKDAQPAEAAKLQQQVEYTPEIQEKIKGLDADAQRVIEAAKPKTVDEWRRLAIKLGVEANDKIAQQIKNTPKAANNEQKAKLEAEKARVEKQIANLRDIANMVGGSSSQSTPEGKDKPETPPDTTDRKAIGSKITSGLAKSKLPPEQQKEYADSINSLMESMPEPAVARIGKHAGETTFHPDSKTLADQLSSRSPKIKKAVDEGRAVAGAYNRKTGELHLDGGAKDQSPTEVHAHELAHAIDGPDREYSGSDEWKKAFETELSSGQLSKYASQSPSEAFAEFGRMLYGRQVSYKDLKNKYPQATAFFESKGLLPLGGDEKPKVPEVFDGKPTEDGDNHVDHLAKTKKETKSLPEIPVEKAPDYDVGQRQIDAMLDAAKKSSKEQRFGGIGDRIYLHKLYDLVKDNPDFKGMSLDQFKKRAAQLFQQQRSYDRELSLNRADLVQAMNSKDVEDSSVDFGGTPLNFLVIPEGDQKSESSTPATADKIKPDTNLKDKYPDLPFEDDEPESKPSQSAEEKKPEPNSLSGRAKEDYDDNLPTMLKQVDRESSANKKMIAAVGVLDGLHPEAQKKMAEKLLSDHPDVKEYIVRNPKSVPVRMANAFQTSGGEPAKSLSDQVTGKTPQTELWKLHSEAKKADSKAYKEFLDTVTSKKGSDFLRSLATDAGVPLGVNPGGKGTDMATPGEIIKRMIAKNENTKAEAKASESLNAAESKKAVAEEQRKKEYEANASPQVKKIVESYQSLLPKFRDKTITDKDLRAFRNSFEGLKKKDLLILAKGLGESTGLTNRSSEEAIIKRLNETIDRVYADSMRETI